MTRKTKICERCGKPSYIHSYGMCENCRNIMYWKWDHNRPTRTFKEHMTGDTEAPEISTETKKKAHTELKSEEKRAMDRADEWFSRFIRLTHSIETKDGRICECYTCGNFKPILNIDNGHWIQREKKQTRYHENNCRPQCTHCNQYKGGRHSTFKQHLEADIGEEAVRKLEVISRIGKKKFTSIELREVAKYYREKVKELQNQFNIKYW